MSKITSYNRLIVFILGVFYLVGCQDSSIEDAVPGLTIKAFSPTVVMSGAEMTIVGHSLDQVSTIVFPGNIEITDFEVVTVNQITVSIPSDIPAEGGHLQLVSNNKTVKSKVAMRVAKPEIKSLLPGDEVGIGGQLKIKGVDLEYTKQIVFPAETEGEVVTVEVMDFLRKASEDIKFTVPSGVKTGDITITLIAQNGESVVSQAIKVTGGGPPALDYFLYNDNRAEGWDDWGWGAVDWVSTATVFSGTNALMKTFDGSWDVARMHTGTSIDVSGYTELVFYVYGGEGYVEQELLVLVNEGWDTGYVFKAVAGEWTQVIIPIADINSGGSTETWNDFMFRSGMTGTVFFDYVGLR